ncbi:transaldolase [Cryobacterium sp. PH29-G1]|uniref:transaldolase n=1 Tax=Cryobacterium sp. PH29-G1 TaxID=3046211 RepID=UPI0024BB37BA|nr:transaldolase [Cryobacterium sp. PH29-G1]MDJ0350200.1 transaldolase [Cryobacterium sp. PH29-G1]
MGEHSGSNTAALSSAGVSIWLDDLSRARISSGGLRTLIAERNVVGITTNPTIFAAALAGGNAYIEQLAVLAAAGASVTETVFALTTADVAAACDVFLPVYEATDGLDGRVSIEVSPAVAHDAAATLEEVERLHAAVARPNAYIKIPATEEGLEAIAEATARGISVNVTLIFSLDRYRGVIDAYLDGLARAYAAGLDLAGIRSVASFFVSRVDTEVDRQLEQIGTPSALGLRGLAGIANARLAHELFVREFSTVRATRLLDLGAHRQRPLWASTGVKNPALRDTLYVEELVVSGVVNTMPEKTLEAFSDHGQVRGDTITGGYGPARQLLENLSALGISYDEVTATLEREGIEKFAASWAELTATVTTALRANQPQ